MASWVQDLSIQQEAQSLALKQLKLKLGDVAEAIQAKINQLPLMQPESLGEALLVFETLADLEAWLAAITPSIEGSPIGQS
ncbi:MAG: DUF4351 domain-containing protein [Leptolyngbyaceae cyanobacterium]